MVVIPVKSQYVSLFVTLISCFAELSLFGAALGFNKYTECMALRKGKEVSVLGHRFRTKFLALAAMFVFIILEVIMSFLSDPALNSQPRLVPCISLVNAREGRGVLVKGESIGINCDGADGGMISQRLGNLSIESNEVICDKTPSYVFNNTNSEVRSIGNSSLHCASDSYCVFGFSSGKKVYISIPINSRDAELARQSNGIWQFLETEVNYDITGLLPEYLKRASEAFMVNAADGMDIRRRVFAGAKEATCNFPVQEDATEVPLALIYGIAAAWAVSFLSFISTLFFRRSIFYDMSDPLHWAQRTYRNADEALDGDLVVTSVYEHGERTMYVSSSTAESGDLLRRVRTGFLDRLRSRGVRSGDAKSNSDLQEVDEEIYA